MMHSLLVPKQDKVVEALEDTLLGSPPTFEEYLQAVRTRSSKSARRLTGLTYALMKRWPKNICMLMYDLLASPWDAKMTADWWQFRWLVPIPKQLVQPSLQTMRPIVLLEVTKIWWRGSIITKIMRVIEEKNVLCSAQYGSWRHRSTASANQIFKNALESAWVQTAKTLLRLSKNGVKAIPKKELTADRLRWLRRMRICTWSQW